MVNYIRHMKGSWQHFRKDRRLTTTHKVLYLALFECWNRNRFRNPISIARDDIMWDTSINSSKLYYKCMKDLHDWGYIQYKPSNNMYTGSKVLLCRYDLTEVPADDATDTPTGFPAADEPGAHSINSTNSINDTNIETSVNGRNGIKPAPRQAQKKNDFRDKKSTTSEKPPSEKGTTGGTAAAPDVPRSLKQVIKLFEKNEVDATEAEKFFNYYESIGWFASGQKPIRDWRACARTWILRMEEFENSIPVRPIAKKPTVQLTGKKNYAERF